MNRMHYIYLFARWVDGTIGIYTSKKQVIQTVNKSYMAESLEE